MQNSNPETDSFAYMETVLESLAVLSRLGSALDNVAQRVPNEIFSLVETTLDEVSDRAEYGRRGSVYALMRGATRSEGVYVFATSASSMSNRAAGKGDYLNPSCLRLSALESSAKQVDHEILKDFFWTLYSKMDAVAQGLRVIYEVANRIGSVSASLISYNLDLCWFLVAARFQGCSRDEAWRSFPSDRHLDVSAVRGQCFFPTRGFPS